MRSHRRLPPRLALVALLALPSLARAEEPGHASGWFQSAGSKLGITDAYAFHGDSSLGGEKVILVALSNQGFVPAEIDRYWDRRYVLDHFFRDATTGIVYFELALDGAYRGLSYDFGAGDGCVYCSGGVESTVKLVDGRLRGKLSEKPGGDQRSFDVTLDVAVASDEHGAPQGAGGGEPGKAYLAYDRALTSGDRAALAGLLSSARRSTWKSAEHDGRGDDFVAVLGEEHPANVAVVEGYVQGNQALLLLAGRGAAGPTHGEALMTREQGAWRFEEETLEPAAD